MFYRDGRRKAVYRVGIYYSKGAVEWFLSFGDKVKVLGPPEMVEIMKSTLDSIKIYTNHDTQLSCFKCYSIEKTGGVFCEI